MTEGSGSPITYTFDASANLTTLPTGASGTYDKAGELTSSSLSGTTTSYSYNADGQRLAARQGSTTMASAGWNGAGQLTSYADGAANMSAAAYDGNGLRATDTATPAGGAQSTQNFVWGTLSSAPVPLMDSVNAYIYGPARTPGEQVNLSTGNVTYLVADRLGSVRGTVSSSGALTASTSYDAWGNPTAPGGLTGSTPVGYAGAYTDPTGLIYLMHRYYDPGTGQFISLDPAIGLTHEPYGYAGGNPVNATDPTGLGNIAVGVHCKGVASSGNWHGTICVGIEEKVNAAGVAYAPRVGYTIRSGGLAQVFATHVYLRGCDLGGSCDREDSSYSLLANLRGIKHYWMRGDWSTPVIGFHYWGAGYGLNMMWTNNQVACYGGCNYNNSPGNEARHTLYGYREP